MCKRANPQIRRPCSCLGNSAGGYFGAGTIETVRAHVDVAASQVRFSHRLSFNAFKPHVLKVLVLS